MNNRNNISLNPNLNKHLKASRSETRNTDRYVLVFVDLYRLQKISADSKSGVNLKDKLQNNTNCGINNTSIMQKGILNQINNNHELSKCLKSLENNILIPGSTINSNRKKEMKSRNSSRNLRNRSQSNSKRYNGKFLVNKQSNIPHSRGLRKIDAYKPKATISQLKQDDSLGKRSKSK